MALPRLHRLQTLPPHLLSQLALVRVTSLTVHHFRHRTHIITTTRRLQERRVAPVLQFQAGDYIPRLIRRAKTDWPG
jgi:hypothetical protein